MEEEGRGKGIADTSESEDSPRCFHLDPPKWTSTIFYELSSRDGNSWEMAFYQVQLKLGREFLWAKAQHVWLQKGSWLKNKPTNRSAKVGSGCSSSYLCAYDIL